MTAKTLADDPISPRRIYYHRERLRNQIFDCVLKALADRVKLGHANKAIIARRLDKDPAQITRWFSGPSNWTIDTISDLMLALDAAFISDYRLYEYIPRPNYQHPLADALGMGDASSSVAIIRRENDDAGSQTGSGSNDVRPVITIRAST